MQLIRQFGQALLVSGDEDQVIASPSEAVSVDGTDAGRGASDEGGSKGGGSHNVKLLAIMDSVACVLIVSYYHNAMNRRSNFVGTSCALTRGLMKVGDTWSMLVLRDVALGLTKFDQLRASLGIAPNILSRRLRSLTEAGVLERRKYSERPTREEYLLTQAGSDFLPVLYVIAEWGLHHNGEGRVTRLSDTETGAFVRPIVIDKVTGLDLLDRPIRLTLDDIKDHA